MLQWYIINPTILKNLTILKHEKTKQTIILDMVRVIVITPLDLC
jgi:hypothetical protein